MANANNYRLEIAFDACGDEETLQQYVRWLNEQGHEAKAGTTTASYVNGRWTSTDDEARAILNKLWEAFCND